MRKTIKMGKMEFSAIEKEMTAIKLEDLHTHTETAKANIANAKNAADVKTAICDFWSKYGKFIKWAENIPVAGKYVKALADLLDTLCV